LKQFSSLPLIFALLVVAPSACSAGAVIVNDQLEVHPHDVRDIFLGEKQLANGVKLVPVDNTAAQERFLAKVLQTDAQKYAARWVRKSFREGIQAPAVKGSDAEVIALVKSTPGAIGYVAQAPPGVKVLLTF
jgi:ABC-type phosphate transport system substrate-binding protein